MKQKFKRIVSVFLILILAVSMIPFVNASAATQTGILLFNYSGNGNYTTTLNTQLAVTYKLNGTGAQKTAYIKNLGWHHARYNNVAYPDDPLYCIEPYRDFAASMGGNSVDRDVSVNGTGSSSGSNVWFALPAERRNAIGMILLYSNQIWDHSISVTTTARDSNPNVPLRIATQFLIYEIVCGLRDPVSFVRNTANECGTDGAIFYNAGVAAVGDFSYYYEKLVQEILAAGTIPSFTGAATDSAPVISLDDSAISITDTNGVLAQWSFDDNNGSSFRKDGNTLTITQAGDIEESTVFHATKTIPSPENSTFNIWYMSGSTYQTTISLATANTGNIYAYFKLKAPASAMLLIRKATDDGANLEGWQFHLYGDADCTQLLSGPHTTDSSGNIEITDLSPGTIYVKETGHTNSAVNDQYSCVSTNPQEITLTAGQTASVSFHNKLKTGSVQLRKETNTGENLGGWKIGLYYDAACTNTVSGSPFTTSNDGTITVSDLYPGTLYAKELPTDDPYWVTDTEVKTVSIVAEQTATVTFDNTHLGRIKLQKSTNTGNYLGGWTFRIKNADGSLVGDYNTDDTGTAYTDYLPLGQYTVIELSTEDNYWTGELGFHDVVVKGGKDTVDEWFNREQGLAWFYKSTNTGAELSGWEITVYSDKACSEKVCTIITEENGRIGHYLDPGTYYAKETGDTLGRFDNKYWLVDKTVYCFEIKPHEETAVTFTNTHYGRIQIQKSMPDGGNLDGWQFRITDSSGKEIEGSPFTTNASGLILTGKLQPGEYTVTELIPEDSFYYCTSENPQTITVKAGETAQVSFTNAMRYGQITIEKVDSRGEPLAGAKFMLQWSEDGSLWWPIEYSETLGEGKCSNPNIEDGCLTSGKDGLLEWTDLYPGLYYRVTELEAPKGYTLLSKPAFEGKLPNEELTVSLRVVNCEIFTLPQTGSSAAAFFRISQLLCVCVCSILLIHSYRKECKK